MTYLFPKINALSTTCHWRLTCLCKYARPPSSYALLWPTSTMTMHIWSLLSLFSLKCGFLHSLYNFGHNYCRNKMWADIISVYVHWSYLHFVCPFGKHYIYIIWFLINMVIKADLLNFLQKTLCEIRVVICFRINSCSKNDKNN